MEQPLTTLERRIFLVTFRYPSTLSLKLYILLSQNSQNSVIHVQHKVNNIMYLKKIENLTFYHYITSSHSVNGQIAVVYLLMFL